MRVGHIAGPRMRLGQPKIAWMASIVRASLRENERIRGVVTDQIARGEVKFRRTHGKTRTTGCHVITAPRVIGPDAPTTLDTTGCGPVGQANAALTPFGGLPVEPSDGRSEVGSSDLVQPVLRGVDHCHFVPLLGLIGEGRQRHRRRSSEFLSALRRHLPGEEYAQVCWACAAIVGTCL